MSELDAQMSQRAAMRSLLGESTFNLEESRRKRVARRTRRKSKLGRAKTAALIAMAVGGLSQRPNPKVHDTYAKSPIAVGGGAKSESR
jgi:hypothetical protein